MRTIWGGAAVLAALFAAVTGCGSESGSQAPSAAELGKRAQIAGVSRELVYVAALPGYTRAAGGMGPYGASGFQDVYTSPGGGDVRLTVENGPMPPEGCAKLPIPAAEPSGARVICTRDGGAWYRRSGNRHEYALVKGGRLIRISGLRARATRGLLRDGGDGARPATPAELDEMLPDGPPAPAGPLDTVPRGGDDEMPDRGDLPADGDGAPGNEVGPGG